MHGTRQGLMRVGAAALALAVMVATVSAQSRTSGRFTGVKANTGTVTLSTSGKSQVLTLSEDFKAPDAPDPHWQVVDSRGRVYLLQKLTVKGLVGDKMNRSITLPAYITGVMAFVTGVISVYSSSSGVVLPAFLPTIPGLVEHLPGASPLMIAYSVNVGAHLVDVSPLSTIGALCLASAAPGEDRQMLFAKLMGWGWSMAIVGATSRTPAFCVSYSSS